MGELSLAVQAHRFTNWLQQEALPLWLAVGMNKKTGGHYERLLADGSADITSQVRTRVLARQAYAFALASSRGWALEGLPAAIRLSDCLERNARHPQTIDGYVHKLGADCTAVDFTVDLYDQAFILLAFAELYRVTADAWYLARAEALMAWIDEHWRSVAGGWHEGSYRARYRRQNPHMHLFEAFMAWYECSGDYQWRVRAEAIFELFQQRFFNTTHHVVYELFSTDWAPLAAADGSMIEPGHLMEWVWLLRWYERLFGQPVDHWANRLYQKAIAIGFSASGLMYDGLSLEGVATRQTKRLWPMTEAIKAHVAQARAGNRDSEALAANAIDTLFRYYLNDAVPGSWLDQRDERDQVVVDLAPASTLYHIVVACREVEDYLDGLSATSLGRS